MRAEKGWESMEYCCSLWGVFFGENKNKNGLGISDAEAGGEGGLEDTKPLVCVDRRAVRMMMIWRLMFCCSAALISYISCFVGWGAKLP
jgi:hypothetical protein